MLSGLLVLAFVAQGPVSALGQRPGDGAPSQVPVRVFLVAGQSNAEGADAHASEIDQFPPYVGAGDPQARSILWYQLGGPSGPGSNGWIPMQPSLQSGTFGPELTFARKVTGETGARLAIVKSTKGGTNLASDWDPNATTGERMYAHTMQLLRDALGELDSQGVAWRLEGVIWHQGENDMLDNAHVQQYGQRLAALIDRLRTDVGDPQLPWFVGGTSFKCIWGLDYADNMRVLLQQQLSVTGADPLVTFVPTSHLAFDVFANGQPHYHFGTEGQLQLGEAYAREYLRSIGYDVRHHPATFSNGLPASPGDTVRVFVLAGQRSMEGEGAYVSEIGNHAQFAGLDAPQDDVLYRYRLGGGVHTARTWAPLGPTGYLESFGPELSFGRDVSRLLEDPVAVIKIADSAAFLVDWLPGHPSSSRQQYQDAVRFIQMALDDLTREGLNPVLEAVLWLPAEHDAWWSPYRTKYAIRLPMVVANLRHDLGAPGLKWFVPELRDDLIWGQPELDDLDAKIQVVAAADPLLWFIRTDTLSAAPPAPTFGTLGALELGRVLARAYAWTLP